MKPVNAIPLTAKKRGKVAPIRFAHIVMKTARFSEMIKWYQTVLEAEIAQNAGMMCFLTYDQEHHRIAFADMPDLADRDQQSNGIEHFAYTYENLGDLLFTYQRLRDKSIEPYWCINHGPTLSFYYHDPDGNQVELQIDVFDSVEGTSAWFAKSDFDVNPIGVKFDPDDFIKRLEAGEAEETLLVRPVIDPLKVPDQLPTP